MRVIDYAEMTDEEFESIGGKIVEFDLFPVAREVMEAAAAVMPMSAAQIVMAAAVNPLDSNLRGVRIDGNGKVVGIKCEYAPVPGQLYDLKLAKLIDENNAQGNTVFMWDIVDQGMQVPVNVWMAWPWPENKFRALPGNPNRQHTMTSKFPGDGRVGPLFFYPGDDQGKPIGAILAGGGLLEGRHYCIYAGWVADKPIVIDPDPDPDDPPTESPDLTKAVDRLANAMELQNALLRRVYNLDGDE